VTHLNPHDQELLKRNLWASCWCSGTHAANNNNYNIIVNNYILCHVLNSVLSYISGLCTAAVEQQELHEDNTFALNSEIPSIGRTYVTYVTIHFLIMMSSVWYFYTIATI